MYKHLLTQIRMPQNSTWTTYSFLPDGTVRSQPLARKPSLAEPPPTPLYLPSTITLPPALVKAHLRSPPPGEGSVNRHDKPLPTIAFLLQYVNSKPHDGQFESLHLVEMRWRRRPYAPGNGDKTGNPHY